MSRVSHVKRLFPCERSTLWVYFFSEICYHDNRKKIQKKVDLKKKKREREREREREIVYIYMCGMRERMRKRKSVCVCVYVCVL